MDGSSFNINNTKNYCEELSVSNIGNYYKSICHLMGEFLIYTVDNIKVQNNKYYLFIIRRGLETIIHCYKFLLMYTRNFELALFHCKKSYIYYVEFIGQIGYNSNSFLQLNSKDATLFVYKKTIFDINNDKRKTLSLTSKEKMHLEIISSILSLYKKLSLQILESETNLQESLGPIIQFCSKHCNKIVENVYHKKISSSENIDNISKITYFADEIIKKHIKNKLYFLNIINCFAKKIKKIEITFEHMRYKMMSDKFDEILGNNSYLKFVNWFFAK